MYRRSNYCIFVDLEDATEKTMMLHSYTGAMDVVHTEIADFLRKHPQFEQTEINFSKEALALLVARGYITNKTAAEEKQYVCRFAELLHKDSTRHTKGFVFMVSYNCNFRCPYCYEAGISEDGRKWSKKTFTKEMIDRAYEAIAEIEPDETKRYKVITLYGGEPFLKENAEAVEYMVLRGKELGYSFDAVSNGHDLDVYENVLATGAILNIQITIDGSREMHDSRRYHHETGKSFDKIFENIKLALKHNVSVAIRVNTDANNFGEIKKLEALFKEAGFYDTKKFSLNPALLRDEEGGVTPDSSLLEKGQTGSTIADESGDIRYISREEFNKMYKEAGLQVNHQNYGLYKMLLNVLKEGNYLRFHSIFCGVQSNSFILDPYGDIYTCWETVGVKKHIIGNYQNGIEWTEEMKNWRSRNVGNTPKCSNCKYALLCGGGCMAKALRFGDSYQASFCDDYESIVKITLNQVYNDWVKMNAVQS